MKTIDQILQEVAENKNCDDFDLLVRRMPTMLIIKAVKEAMEIHAKQCCDEQIKACAEKYDNSNDELDYYQVIISTPNVAENK